MKATDILSSLPHWASATPRELLASPAWSVPCRLGDSQCSLRHADVKPSDTLDLTVRLESEDHILGIADSPALPELHAIWQSRTELPEPLLLALVEKDCAPLLQLVENACRRQLKVIGLAASADKPEDQTEFAQVCSDGTPLLTFSLSLSPAVESAFGQLRNIDPAHSSVRDAPLSAEVEYASFALPESDLATIAPGDALLLPEIETLPPRIVAESRLVALESGVALWQDDGMLRVCAADPAPITVGALLDAADGKASGLPLGLPVENAPLKLVRAGKVIATGRLCTVGGKKAFTCDSVAM